MKAKVYINQALRALVAKSIDIEREEYICHQVFQIEVEVEYRIKILGIRFNPEQKIMPWNSTFANYCFGKGKISFETFKRCCYALLEPEAEVA